MTIPHALRTSSFRTFNPCLSEHTMAPQLTQTLALHAHEAVRRDGPLWLRAQSGLLWVTVDGDREDILLAAGESRRFERAAAVIVYALGGEARADIVDERPAAVAWWQRVAARFAARNHRVLPA
jgi:hypothetical protein